MSALQSRSKWPAHNGGVCYSYGCVWNQPYLLKKRLEPTGLKVQRSPGCQT